MSLSFWLRDYLYIPLGGNRLGELKTYRNQMITMLLGGLWHGAAWNFVIWGGIHGMALAVHRAFMGKNKHRVLFPLAGGVFGLLMTVIVVFAAWVPFRAANLGDTLSVWFAATGLREGGASQLSFVAFLVPLLLVVDSLFSQAGFLKRLSRVPLLRAPAFYWAGAGCLTALALALYQLKSAPFVYFQF